MRASQTQRPQPLPLPLPPPPLCLPSPPAAPRRRGRHRSSSYSSSSSSVSSAASTFCPSPSPGASPPLGRSSSSTSSLVPFSWERHPGVPKNSFRSGLTSSPTTGTPLPLPPPLRPAPRRCRRPRPRAKGPAASGAASDASGDPFIAAFAECTRDDDDEADHGADAVTTAGKDNLSWLAPAKPTVSGRAWRPATTGGGFLGFLDLYGCKSAIAVADGVFLARRPAVAARPGGPASGRATTRR